MSEKKRIFTNMMLHSMDPFNSELSHTHLRKIIEEFQRAGIRTDIYLSTGLAQSIMTCCKDSRLLDVLKNAANNGYGVGMLTLTSHPMPAEAAVNLEWEEAYKLTEKYATFEQDLYSGKFKNDKLGGGLLYEKLFGRWPDIITRRIVTDVYYHRRKGAIISLGGFPRDILNGWIAPPIAWFMGMVAIVQYPMAENAWDYIYWPAESNDSMRLLQLIINSIPGKSPHFLYIGGHNVDFYANNPCWTSKALGYPRHVEMWAYLKGNPSCLREAKIPEHYLLSKESIERNYRILKVVLGTFKKRAEIDPNFEIVTAREFVKRVLKNKKQNIKYEEILDIASFIIDESNRGLPEWVTVKKSKHFTLCETFGILVSVLAGWHKKKSLPSNLMTDGNLIGPTKRPLEWCTGDVNFIQNRKALQVSLEEIAECCSNIIMDLGKTEPPNIPIQIHFNNHKINVAEFLYICAKAIIKISRVQKGSIKVKRLTVHPDPCMGRRELWLSDEEISKKSISEQLFRLQLWTVKPVVFID